MKSFFLFSCFVLFSIVIVTTSSFAQEPSYEVHRVSTPITVDGIVTEEEWGGASPAVEFIFPWDEQTGAKQKTRARLLWDNTNLYVAYECEDADINAQFTNLDFCVESVGDGV